jgi:SNF2 family DNA or RNA helicase
MHVVLEADKLYLQSRFEERDTLKALGARWNAQRRQWMLDCDMLSLALLRQTQMVENKATLDELDEKLFEDSKTYDGKTKDILTKVEPKRYFHQWYSALRLLNRKRLAIFMFMGSGKTRTVLDAIQTAFSDRNIRNALVVAPLTVVSVWEREIKKWLVVPYDVYRITGSKEEKEAMIERVRKHKNDTRLCIVLTNYESVIEREIDDSFGEEAPGQKKPKDASVERHEFFGSFGWNFVVADEAHRCKSRVAKITKSMIRIADKAQYVTALTGTPVSSSFVDLFAPLRLVDRHCFGGTYRRFEERFAVMGGWQGRQVVGLRQSNSEEFWSAVRRFSIVMPADQTMTLPEKIYEKREYELYGDQLAVYKRLEKEFLIEVDNVHAEKDGAKIAILCKNALVKANMLVQICGGYVYSNSGEPIRLHQNAKLRELEELIEEAGDERIVIYTRFREEVSILRDALAKKYPFGVIAGDVSEPARVEAIKAFSEGPGPRVLVVQAQAGGLGIDLSAARIGIFYTSPWGYAARSQCESRIHRPPQDRSVVIYDLIGTDIERKVMTALAERKTLAELLFKGVTLTQEILEQANV